MAQKVAKGKRQKIICTIISWALMIIGAIPFTLLGLAWLISLTSEAQVEIRTWSLITGAVVFCAGFAVGEIGHRFYRGGNDG